MKKVSKALPSMVTCGNLACGFLALAYIVEGRIVPAAALLFVGMVFDMLDGKVARLTNGSSDFGGQLDSLTDMISFGLVPGFMIKVYLLSDPICCPFWLAWLTGFFFVLCAALRLARFNCNMDHDETAHEYFEGLATPAATGAIASCLLINETMTQIIPEQSYKIFILFLSLAVATLMISKIRYLHAGIALLKKGKKSWEYTFFVAFLTVVIIEPKILFFSLTFIFLSYALYSPAKSIIVTVFTDNSLAPVDGQEYIND